MNTLTLAALSLSPLLAIVSPSGSYTCMHLAMAVIIALCSVIAILLFAAPAIEITLEDESPAAETALALTPAPIALLVSAPTSIDAIATAVIGALGVVLVHLPVGALPLNVFDLTGLAIAGSALLGSVLLFGGADRVELVTCEADPVDPCAICYRSPLPSLGIDDLFFKKTSKVIDGSAVLM